MLKPKPDWNWLGIQLGNLFGTLLEHYWNLTEARRRNQSLKTNLDVYHEPCPNGSLREPGAKFFWIAAPVLGMMICM
jgi:hypothetical protein